MNERADSGAKARRAGGRAPAGMILCLILLGLLVTPCSLLAQGSGGDAKLKGRVTSMTMRKRNAGPAPLIVEFDNRGSKLVEGVIELVIRSRYADPGGAPLFRYTGPEVALTTGTQSFRLMLPGLPPVAGGEVMARLLLRTRDGAIDFGESQISVQDMWPRTFTTAVVEPMAGANPDKTLMQASQSLRFERFDPDKGDPKVRRVGTAASYMISEETPAAPLMWCAYDLVLVSGPALALMRERQVDALRRWVEGGGSLCVGVGSGLKDYHRNFLNGLAAGAQPIVVDAPGGGVARAPGVKDYVLLRPGVGRSAVLFQFPGPETDGELREWREIAAFLWRVRKMHLAAALETGLLPLRPERPDNASMQWNVNCQRQVSETLAPVGPPGPSWFSQGMLPRGIRLIPLGLVVALLVVFLLLIGPVDYLVLGWLGKRRYTWLTLPLVCVGFTALMVLLANYYVGRRDYRSAVTIIDVGPDNRPVRQSRIEMLFSGSSRVCATPLKDALFMAVQEPAMLSCEGRVPAAYQVTQRLQQWKPQMNRTFTFDVPQPEHQVRWNAFVPPREARTSRDRDGQRLSREGLGQAPGGSYAVMHCGEVSGPGGFMIGQQQMQVTAYSPRGDNSGTRWAHLMLPSGLLWEVTAPTPGYHEIFARLQSRGPTQLPQPPADVRYSGVMDFVSQLSPSNSPMMEDLLLGDTTDPEDRIVLVQFKTKDGYVVYRKVCRTP